jgi:hypothetical protein
MSEQRNVWSEMGGRGIRTVGILHRTREHAPVFAAVSGEGDRYPVTSWSLAWLVGVLYALQKAAQAKSKKMSTELAPVYLLSLKGPHTSVFKNELFRSLFRLHV